VTKIRLYLIKGLYEFEQLFGIVDISPLSDILKLEDKLLLHFAIVLVIVEFVSQPITVIP
jgi:hypothetical protein